MLGINNVNVLENPSKPKVATRHIDEWPILDERGDTFDDIPRKKGGRQVAIGPRKKPEKNELRWREKTPETEDEKSVAPVERREFDEEVSTDDDLDGDDDEEMNMAIKTKIGNAERNYMYPQHDPVKSDPAKPPMLKFKASLFSRNVLVVNRALKRLMDRNEPVLKEPEAEDDDTGPRSMVRRTEGRVKSSKRRQAMNVRNQYNELSRHYDDLLKENKLLKQIQKRQEKELERYTNAEEDLPRLLDANSYEIAGLKAKNKQLVYEKRELDDKVRRQHQEIIGLKDSNRKLQTLVHNKKLGEREKLENDLTTSRVTIANQESKIQELTKAVEIYRKTADREVRGHQIQLKKTLKEFHELQDNFNELYVKYKAKEREAGNHYIYAQRARQDKGVKTLNISKLTHSSSNLEGPLTTPAPSVKPKEDRNERLLETLDSELSSQAEDLKTLQKEFKKAKASSPIKPRKISESTLSDSDHHSEPFALESEDEPESPQPEVKPKVEISPRIEKSPEKPTVFSKPFDIRKNASDDTERSRNAEEMRKEAERLEREEAERLRRETAERIKQEEAERMKREEAERLRKEEEEAERLREEARLLEEKRLKDEAVKDKLAALKRVNAGDDFMSQLKAKKSTSIPSSTPNSIIDSITPDTSADNRPFATRNARVTPKDDSSHQTKILNNGRNDATYQPSFTAANPRGIKTINRADPLDVGYTPSFNKGSTRKSTSREEKKTTWTPVGRASVTERNGLFDNQNANRPAPARRRSLKQNNQARRPSYGDDLIDDDVEELVL